MEQNQEVNTIITQKENSKVSTFINAEKDDLLEMSTDLNKSLESNEQNDKDELSQSVNKDEPELTYQDVLGSGDLLKKIIKQGAPDERPMKGEQIVINLVGRLEDKNIIIEEEKNLEITLGDCEV